MADYTVVPANVLASLQAQTSTGTAGEAITAGQAVYQAADGSIKLYDANGAAPVNVMKGIAQHASLTGQPISYVRSDPSFAPGFTMAVGDVVIGSALVPGNLCPDADKAAGWFVTTVGIAITTTTLKLQILASGVAR